MRSEFNPKKLHPSFKNFTEILKKAQKSGKINNGQIRIVYPNTNYVFLHGEIELLEYIFTIDYLKARAYDESENIQYEMTEEIMKQVFFTLPIIESRTKELADWLEKIAIKRRNEIINKF